ncbi:MAG: hypothetical protein JSV69_12170 [Chloroflexota bacterium]|nr:MAG: hypothetical protein JSV69_12170 [Chloroflexota bacterium]
MANSNLDSDGDQSPDLPEQLPLSVRITRWLFVILGIIWLVFGTWRFIRFGNNSGEISGTMLVIVIALMFINSAVFFWISWGIGRGLRLYYYFGLLALAGNIFLTLMDEFGLFDLIVLGIAIALFVLLILTRSNYLKN